ncbi:MAG: hypothetical protein H0W90_11200 [Actinobacteria bacterium]|nr:hypothetical protein [Actinomycetota bacterium]
MKLLLAPSLIVVASVVARRFGVRVGGVVAVRVVRRFCFCLVQTPRLCRLSRIRGGTCRYARRAR